MSAIIKGILLFCLLNFSGYGHYRVLGVGSYIWDYVHPVDDAFLEQMQITKCSDQDMGWPEFNEVLALVQHQQKASLRTGGRVANTIRGLAALGVTAALTGNVGLDRSGDALIFEMEKVGVLPLITRTETPTAHMASLITPDGGRTYCSFVAAEIEIKESDILPKYFDGVDLVLIEGYLLRNKSVVEHAAQLAQAHGATICYDVGGAQFGEQYRERLWGLLSKYVDILFVDESQAFALTHLPPRQACRFLSHFCKIAVVRASEEGCYASSGDTHLHQPAIPTTVVDYLGGGDLFTAGFLYGFLHGAPLERCALFGNLMGSAAIENFGGDIPPARLNEIVQAMK